MMCIKKIVYYQARYHYFVQIFQKGSVTVKMRNRKGGVDLLHLLLTISIISIAFALFIPIIDSYREAALSEEFAHVFGINIEDEVLRKKYKDIIQRKIDDHLIDLAKKHKREVDNLESVLPAITDRQPVGGESVNDFIQRQEKELSDYQERKSKVEDQVNQKLNEFRSAKQIAEDLGFETLDSPGAYLGSPHTYLEAR